MLNASQSTRYERANLLRLVLRDMGNGVTRVEDAVLMCGDADIACADLIGFAPVQFPLGDRYLDCVASSMIALGADDEASFSAGLVRPVCDRITELMLW